MSGTAVKEASMKGPSNKANNGTMPELKGQHLLARCPLHLPSEGQPQGP